ncbi:MAG: hypothetical protein ACYDDF_15005 [Thermoplasmatota archaeon]
MVSETTSQLIFFIAASALAAGVSAVLSNDVLQTAGKITQRSATLGDAITTDISIINDPNAIPTSPLVLYVENVGTATPDPNLSTVLIDGTPHSFTAGLVGGATEWEQGSVAAYTISGPLATGDHDARVTTENGVHADFRFRT